MLIVNGAAEEKKEITSEEIKESIEEGIKSGLSKKDAVVQTAQRFDLKKNEVYKLSLEE